MKQNTHILCAQVDKFRQMYTPVCITSYHKKFSFAPDLSIPTPI